MGNFPLSTANAPFIKRADYVPANAVQRFGPTQTLHMIHYDTPLFGTGQQLGAETNLFTDPNRLGNPDLCSLKEAGKFSDWKQFVLYGLSLQCFFTQDTTTALPAGEAPAAECYDLLVYYSRLHVHYQDSEKQILWSDMVPAGGGVNGFDNIAGNFHLTNGLPVAGGFFKFKEPLVITPQKTFRLVMKWHSSITNITPATANQADPRTRFNAAIRTQKLVRVYMHGVEARDVING